MQPPKKEYLDIPQEEMFALLQSKCNGDLSILTPEIIKETLQPYKKYTLDIPELLKIEQKIEKDFYDLDKIHGEPLENLKKFLKYLEGINTTLKPYSPCKSGCSKCCYISVMIYSLEVSLIEKYLSSNKLLLNYKRKKEMSKNVFTIENDKIYRKEYNGIKCPFLKDNKCDIYEVRPYACRNYITFEENNEKCGHGEGEISFYHSYIAEIAYKNILKYYFAKIKKKETYNVPLGDIREYFYEENSWNDD